MRKELSQLRVKYKTSYNTLIMYYALKNLGQNTSVIDEYDIGPRHTKNGIKMVPVVPLFSPEHSKGKILALSQELR